MKQINAKKILRYTISLVLIEILVGCSFKSSSISHRSSIMDYLYPEKEVKQKIEVPYLKLPLKVGIAFIPESTKVKGLTEDTKISLLNRVSSNFKKYPFVETVTVIPSVYLRKKGSFSNLSQLGNLYDIDVIALVSYDQEQFTDEGILSLSYWTIIGAYIIPASKNDTHTMVDTVVFDIKSKKMLFRAPGLSRIKGNATLINLSEELRLDSKEGFTLASEDLIINLDKELQSFRAKVKKSPEKYKIIHRSGYRGGGSINAVFLSIVLLFLAYGLWLERRKKF